MPTNAIIVPDAALGDRRMRLSTLWVFITLNYLYCDVVTLMDSGKLNQFLAGRVEGMNFTPGVLLASGALMEIPIAMILVSRLLKYRTNRAANLGAGIAMTAVQVATLLTGATAYYWFFSMVEIAGTSIVVWYAWTWVRPLPPTPTADDHQDSPSELHQPVESVSR